MNKNEKFFTLNEASEVTGVNPQTLRNWEKGELIKPLEKFGKHKLFSREQIKEIKNIQKMKEDGMSLQKIKNKKNEQNKKVTESKKKVNYADLSIDELTEIAKNNGIKYFRQMFKDELVEALSKPKNAEKMSLQAKQRTRERYGDKKYGKENQEKLLVAASPIDKIEKTNINKTTGLVKSNKTLIRNIIKLYKNGKNVEEILEEIR